MEQLSLDSNYEHCLFEACAVLSQGDVILYPTDTLYGLGADAFSDNAVDQIYAIKSRDRRKPIHMVCSDIVMIETYVEVNSIAKKLIERFLPGALTLVLKKRDGFDSGIGRNMQTLGVRIPNNLFCIQLAERFGKPFTTTSANVSGANSRLSVTEIISQLGLSAQNIRVVIDAGSVKQSTASTVIDLSSGELRLFREGAISMGEITSFLEEA